jgi:hypothetical protein
LISLKTKPSKFLLISIIVHLALIFLIARGKLSSDIKDTRKENIASYIIFKQPTLPKVQDNTIKIADEKNEQLPEKQAIKSEVKVAPLVKDNGKEKTTVAAAAEVQENSIVAAEKPVTSIKNATSRYIQEANNMALDELSSSSLSKFLKPKPINTNSSSTAAKRIQKDLDESFAPLGADITVVSQMGSETLILHGESCYQVRETALDDKVYRGAAVWTGSSACGKRDEFNGQLQISLDKYLKK